MQDKIPAFFEFVYDRQHVWHKRNVLQATSPWSEDEVLKNYKFCNIYRELDAGTMVISKHLVQNISAAQKLFNIIAYRFFNRRDTIENLFGGLLNPNDFDVKKYEKRFDAKKEKESIFSNAYLISSHPYNEEYRPKDKHVQVLLMLDDLRHKLGEIIAKLQFSSPQEGLNIIENNVKMAGPFLSGQILLDATYAKNIVSYSSNDFLIVGPGAHWGLNIIFDKKLSKKEADNKCRYLHSVQEQEFDNLKQQKNKDWFLVNWKNESYANYPYISLHDIQNSLCEFRKYWRLKNGEKAKKRYFK